MTTKIDKRNFKIEQVIAPATFMADTVSGAIDTQGFGALTLVANTGAFGDVDTVSGANYINFIVQHSDDTVSGDFVNVAASDISDTVVSGSAVGVFTRIDGTNSGGQAYATGYIGGKRYVRFFIDFNGTHTNGTKIACSSIKSHASDQPAN